MHYLWLRKLQAHAGYGLEYLYLFLFHSSTDLTCYIFRCIQWNLNGFIPTEVRIAKSKASISQTLDYMISSIAWLLSFNNFFFFFMAQLNEMFLKGGGELEKGADIDEHFDWHMTHGTYQMREDPGDGRRSDYLSRVKMESTTTNFRQSNERLKNRFMHFFFCSLILLKFGTSQRTSTCLFGFLCLYSGPLHLHLYQSIEPICLFRCKPTSLHKQTHAYTQGRFLLLTAYVFQFCHGSLILSHFVHAEGPVLNI